jgi:prepilin-type N-terminal cleavage/methylation domain-containing protein
MDYYFMKHIKQQKMGFTLIELLVVMSIIALLLSILMPALGRAKAEAMITKDQSQLKSLYGGFSFWAPSHNSKWPIPGLQQRLEDPTMMQNVKGRGPEDMTVNDHASMLSMCIMENLFTPDAVIAPTEQSPYVAIITDYDYDSYSVSDWVFWDKEFQNDLDDVSNNSYGIMPVTGKRKDQNWGVSSNNPTGFGVIGNRGPENGNYDLESNAYSNSYLLHGNDKDWKGCVAFGDGHLEVLDTMYPMSSTYLDAAGASVPDNIFNEEELQEIDTSYGNELGQGADVVLTHVKEGEVNDNLKAGGCDSFLYD